MIIILLIYSIFQLTCSVFLNERLPICFYFELWWQLSEIIYKFKINLWIFPRLYTLYEFIIISLSSYFDSSLAFKNYLQPVNKKGIAQYQVTLGSKCLGSNCHWRASVRRATVVGEQVSREQVSVGSKCRESKCPGSKCRGSNCLGCTFRVTDEVIT
jgi:hypothetical protein